jgi:hypothetical protein
LEGIDDWDKGASLDVGETPHRSTSSLDGVWSTAVIFGDLADFAIEAVSDAGEHTQSRHFVWGHMRIWCNGSWFGNWGESHCSLAAAQDGLVNKARNLDQLVDAELAILDDVAAWTRVNAALYVDDDRDLAKLQADIEYWGRFDFATGWGESFDGYAGVIFIRAENQLCITVRDRSDEIRSYRVSPVGFRVACVSFDHWCHREAAI